MATTAIIPVHVGKGRTVAMVLGLSTDYIKNPEKTDGGEWVTAYECSPSIVDQEFMFSKRQYVAITGRDQGSSDVIAYHLRISFKPGETDAATANKIGYDLAMKLTQGNHAFVCCTHVDKVHTHSHIVFNSTSLCATKKFRNFKGSSFAIRRIADHLCIENGLSIVANPKPSKGKGYGKWMGDTKLPSNREKLEQMIDAALQGCKDYDAFIAALIAAGCEVKRGKNLSIKIPGAERFARCKSLGADYTEDAIMERLMGLRKVARKPVVIDEVFVPFVITRQTKFSLLIDIQQKIQEGKGKAYENWATVYNIKQMARTLIYLQENSIGSYEELVEKSSAASGSFNSKRKRIVEIETRQKEISELQKQIGTYKKTKEIFNLYLRSKRDPDFYETHRADIALHESAKRHFIEAGYGKSKPIPKMDALKQEWAALESEKKTLYRGYRELKDHNRELVIAKDNCERILGIGKDEAGRISERVQKRSHAHEI
jgi:hypothetical protein